MVVADFSGGLLSVLSILAVVIGFGFCVFIHEFGHFLAAKWRKLHVDSFAIGFKAVWRKKWRGVEYRIGCLPFGGYCEIPQIDGSDAIPKAADGTELPPAKPVDRIVVAFAGPFFNILSGLLLGCIVWAAGVPQGTPRMSRMEVCSIDHDSPEYRAGLRVGDVIVEFNGRSFLWSWEEFAKNQSFAGGEGTLTTERGGCRSKGGYIPAPNNHIPGRIGTESIAYPFFNVAVPLKLVVNPGSPAEKAGIRTGDMLVSVDGHAPNSEFEFHEELRRTNGRTVEIAVRRDGAVLRMDVTPVLDKKGRDAAHPYMIDIVMQEFNGLVFVESVGHGGPAEIAGLKAGDIIVAYDDIAVKTASVLQKRLAEDQGKAFTLTWVRDGGEMAMTMMPVERLGYTIGAVPRFIGHPNPLRQFADTFDMTCRSLLGIGVFVGHKAGLTRSSTSIRPSHFSGPLGIGMVLYDSVRSGKFTTAINFMVIVSFALALFNLLPLPVLDGGHIFLGLLEIICRRPVPKSVMKYVTYVFVTLLIAFMLYVTFSDSRRFYGKYIKGRDNAQTH
ncbi:MAG: site-2 protease family protein [Victivallaceae bacterium]|nr:site-2 protease family protein [Victivallaceae bacterium]